jgi:hypothetical protein
MQIFLFGLALIFIFAIHFYLVATFWKFLPAHSVWHFAGIARIVLIVFASLVAISPFVNFFLGKYIPLFLASALHHISYTWITLALYFFFAFILLDICRYFDLFPVARIVYANWWSVGIAAGFAFLVLIFGGMQYSNKVRASQDIELAKYIGPPLTIVGISDLHLGDGIGKKEFESWIELINTENPDIVFLAGDIIDNSIPSVTRRGFAETFAKINARYGVYAVPGNHEYIAGIEESKAFLESAGITFLRDQAVLIDERIYVVGRDDRSNAGRKTLPELLAPLDTEKAIIVIDHQPFNLDDVQANGVDLLFAGHTHRGQIWPISRITDWMYEISHGYLRKGESHIYVTSGIGIWAGKFRIGSQSEYAVFTLSGTEY